jgi:hypothetical protein
MKYYWKPSIVSKYYPKVSSRKDSIYRLCCTIQDLPGLYCWECGIEIFDAPACPICGCDILNMDHDSHNNLGHAQQVIFPMMKHLQILGILYNYDEYMKKIKLDYIPPVIVTSVDENTNLTAHDLLTLIRSCPVQTQNLGLDEKEPKW